WYLSSIVCDFVATEPGKIWIGGPSIGADTLVGASILYMKTIWNRDIYGFLTRKEEKSHGVGGRIPSSGGRIIGVPPHHDSKVILIDDVLTTGASLISSINALKTMKALP